MLLDAGREELAKQDDLRLLSDLRLTTSTGELTRAGLLLVGRERVLRSVLPNYEYSYLYRPSSGAEAVARFRESRPILAAVSRILDAVEARRAVHPLNVGHGGVQLQLHDYSSAAVRELAVNALVHRDYQYVGATEVEHAPDRMIVSNPGGLVFGVTPENILTHPSTPRNRLLLEVVTTLHVAERTGQGVDRVYRELLRSGKKPPIYTDDGTRVAVLVSGGTGNNEFSRYVSDSLGPELGSDVEVLLALGYLRDHKSLKAGQLAPLVQRSAVEAQSALDRMAHAGIIEPSRRTARHPFPTYGLVPDVMAELGRAVTYHRRVADGIDQKVTDHVNEYGYITNQTLRRLFDLEMYAARNLLKDLQARRILTKTDEKRSGPGVRYGPGDKFRER